jgi:hypothetical protein
MAQTDLLSISGVGGSQVVFGGPTRVKAISLYFAPIDVISLYDGISTSDRLVWTLTMPGSIGVGQGIDGQIDIVFPGEGLRFFNSVYYFTSSGSVLTVFFG